MKKHILITRIVMFSILFVLLLNIRITTVDGESMQPTLYNNQILFCNTLDKTPEVGDIVVVKPLICFGGNYVIKRVIEVKDNQIWIEGDNKEHSYDSRDVGYIQISDIFGVCL